MTFPQGNKWQSKYKLSQCRKKHEDSGWIVTLATEREGYKSGNYDTKLGDLYKKVDFIDSKSETLKYALKEKIKNMRSRMC